MEYSQWCNSFFFEFIDRVTGEYQTIFSDKGTSEGKEASEFWFRWGWYGTFVEMAKDEWIPFKQILKAPIKETLTFLEHKIEKSKLTASLRDKNVTQI